MRIQKQKLNNFLTECRVSLYQEREGRKLKEFLEDYDDEKDDVKYYRGRELARRLADRSGLPVYSLV